MGIYQRRHGSARRDTGPRWLSVAALLLCLALPGHAAAQVPYVPTPMDVVERMLGMANVRMGDYLVDLGSGDGRLVRESARRIGNRALGVDIDAERVALSTQLAQRDGVGDKVVFLQQVLFQTDFAEASVITMYLLPAVNLKLRPRLLSTLRPGTRLVSHDFDMGDWIADEAAEMYSKEKFGGSGGASRIFLWIVPADVAGRWQWRMQVGGQARDYELRIAQRFQMLEGTIRIDGEVRSLERIVLRGDALTFTVHAESRGSTVRQTFEARVAADAMQGGVALVGPRIQGMAEFSATRVERGPRPERQASGHGAKASLAAAAR